MSESIKRRNSSKQLLQNLIRVTEQRSQEDAEEVERERRRRAREKQEPQQHNVTHNTESDEELKPSCSVLEEDEGFSDWSHRLENRNEHEVREVCRARETKACAPSGPEEKTQQKDEEHEDRSSDDDSTQHPVKTPSTQNTGRTSFSSSVFVSQDSRLQPSAGQASDRTSYLAAGTMKPRRGACRVDGEVEQRMQEQQEVVEGELKPTLQKEPAETQQSSGEEDNQEEEELSFTKEEKEDVYFTREEREGRGEEEEEEEEQNKRSPKGQRRRSEEVNSSSSGFLVSTSEGEESLNCYGPMSPTFKKLLIQFYPEEANSRVSTDGKCTITERTESLRRSSSSIKKTQPPVSVSKIDKRLEQYTHALEISSKEGKPSCQVLTDLVSPSEPVTTKKNLFEAGETWNQNIFSVPSKDADGLKVGVADLIHQWVKGGEDGSRSNSPSKPAEIRPGGVLNKKNLWENIGDNLSLTRDGKETSTKRYKYVVAGHGKYTKVSADNICSEDVSCQSAGQFCEDL